MTTTLTGVHDRSAVIKGAVVSGAINAVINGVIQFLLLREKGPIPMSVDSISAGTDTVLSSAVPLAVSLAMILTAIAHKTFKGPKPPFLFVGLRLVLLHGIFAFGAIVAGAVVWQRSMGSIEVSATTAAVILGVLAGLVGALVNYLTIEAVAKHDVRVGADE